MVLYIEMALWKYLLLTQRFLDASSKSLLVDETRPVGLNYTVMLYALHSYLNAFNTLCLQVRDLVSDLCTQLGLEHPVSHITHCASV